jgi:hypothetical protein
VSQFDCGGRLLIVAGVLLTDPFPCVQIIGVEAAKDQPVIAELNFPNKVTHIPGIDIARHYPL